MSVITGQTSSGPGEDESKKLSIPAVYAAQLVLLTARFGVDAERLLTGTGIERALVDRPDTRISPQMSTALTLRALELSAEPGLGFYYGLQLKVSTHGSVGMLAMTSATLKDALVVLERFTPLRSPNLRFQHYVEGEQAVLELVETLPERALRVFIIESLFTALIQMSRTLLGRDLGGSVEVSYAEPPYFKRFAHLWPGPVRFNQQRNRILMPKQRLEDALQMADSITAKQIEDECEQELARRTSGDAWLVDLRSQVLSFREGFPSLEQVAKERHISDRTLKRQLKAHNFTYRSFVDELKRERARELLENRMLSIQEIAQRLGYADPANFHRAFRRWYGVTPESFRRTP